MIGSSHILFNKILYASNLDTEYSTDDLAFLPAYKQNLLLKEKKLSLSELAKIYIERQSLIDAKYQLNSFISFDKARTIERAKMIEKSFLKDEGLSSISGFFFSLKDDLEYRLLPMTAGTQVLKNYSPKKNASCVDLLLNSNGIILGKTNLDEFTFGIFGQNEAYGHTKNPYSLNHSPGGSSSGSAVAVAAGLCSVAIGSDASGSVRIPSSLCGIYGFKPTLGAISRDGLIPLVPYKDTIGLMARSAKDIGIVFKELCKVDPNDSLTSAVAKIDSFKKKSTSQIKIAVLDDYVNNSDTDIQKSFSKSIDDLKKMNFKISHKKFENIKMLDESGRIINFVELRACIEQLINKTRPNLKFKEIRNQFQKTIVRYLNEADKMTAISYYNATITNRETIDKKINSLFQEFDFLITPTTGALPPTLSYLSSPQKDRRVFSERIKSPCELAGYLGLPAITLPISQNQDGMPIGLQIIGPKYSDYSLLAFAESLDGKVSHFQRPKSFS